MIIIKREWAGESAAAPFDTISQKIVAILAPFIAVVLTVVAATVVRIAIVTTAKLNVTFTVAVFGMFALVVPKGEFAQFRKIRQITFPS